MSGLSIEPNSSRNSQGCGQEVKNVLMVHFGGGCAGGWVGGWVGVGGGGGGPHNWVSVPILFFFVPPPPPPWWGGCVFN